MDTKRLLALIKEMAATEVAKVGEKSSSSLGNPHGTLYEILVAAHMKRHLLGDDVLEPKHFPHSVDEHLSDVADGEHTKSKEIHDNLNGISDNKREQIKNHAKIDAESMIKHMQENDGERYKELVEGIKKGTSRFVHVPDIRRLKHVVHRNLPKGSALPSLSSNADIVFTNGNTHIGVDTKYGKTGGTTDAGKTNQALLGLLEDGHEKNRTKRIVNSIESFLAKTEKTEQNKSKRAKLMRVLARAHARAFNALSHEERRTRMAQMMNAGSDPNIRTFRLHRDPNQTSATITEPSENFKDNPEGTKFFARTSGQGFHVFRKMPGQKLKQYQRIGISSSGRGKTEEIKRTPKAVSRASVKPPRTYARVRSMVSRVIKAREKNKDKTDNV